MWATRIFNLCTKPLQSLLSHLPFFFKSNTQFKLIPSQGYSCTPDLETARTMERYCAVSHFKPSALHGKWARPLLSSIKQRGGYLLHLFSFLQLWTWPATGAGWARMPQGCGPPNTAVSVGKVMNLPPGVTERMDFRSPLGCWYGPLEWDLCSQLSLMCWEEVQRMKQFSKMVSIP